MGRMLFKARGMSGQSRLNKKLNPRTPLKFNVEAFVQEVAWYVKREAKMGQGSVPTLNSGGLGAATLLLRLHVAHLPQLCCCR